MAYHVGKKEFAEVVQQGIGSLPERFASALEDVRIEVLDRPTRQQLKSVGLGRDDLLLGLYSGTPLTERSVLDSGRLPDVIHLFQEDIELVSDTREQLVEEIRVTLLHEIGHYYGMDEEDLDELGYG